MLRDRLRAWLQVPQGSTSATGALARLRICGGPDCQFVYYDHPRSRTSRWCSTEVGGDRMKTRRYRHRQRG